jgi:hypothetical protein
MAALPRAREICDPQSILPLLSTAALLALASGDASGADALLCEFEERISEAPPRIEMDRLCIFVTMVALGVGEAARAEELVRRHEPVTTFGRLGHVHGRALVTEARGRGDEAAELFAKAADGWAEWGSVPLRAYALLGLGRCAGDSAAHEEGEEIFARLGATPIGAPREPVRQQQV